MHVPFLCNVFLQLGSRKKLKQTARSSTASLFPLTPGTRKCVTLLHGPSRETKAFHCFHKVRFVRGKRSPSVEGKRSIPFPSAQSVGRPLPEHTSAFSHVSHSALRRGDRHRRGSRWRSGARAQTHAGPPGPATHARPPPVARRGRDSAQRPPRPRASLWAGAAEPRIAC